MTENVKNEISLLSVVTEVSTAELLVFFGVHLFWGHFHSTFVDGFHEFNDLRRFSMLEN